MKPKYKLHSLLTGGSTLLAAILLTQSALAADGTWIQVSNGSWTGTANWSEGIIADGATSTANLTANLTASRTITIDTTSRTLGIVNVGDADFFHNYTLAATGGATLTFDNGGSTAQLNAVATSGPTNIFNATLPVRLNDSLAIANASGYPLNILSILGTISSTAAGTKTISNVGTGAGLVTLSGVISNGTGTVAVHQNSATSPMTISGSTNTYTGGNTSSAGTLTISGTAPNTAGGGGPTAINAGGTIVFGTTNSLYANTAADWTPANITVASGGTLAVTTSGFSAANIAFLLASPQLGASTASTGLKPGSSFGFDTTGGNFTYGNVLANLSGGNVLNVSKIGVNTLTLNQTNTYTGTTTAVGGVLLPTTTASLPGYNVSGKVIFNGGTIAVPDVGGAGWATTDVNALLSNATKTSGGLGIDTSAGDLTQWAAFTAANFGSLGLTKVGSNTLTLDQVNTYTGPTLVNGGTLKLANANAISSSSGLVVNGGSVVVDTAVGLGSLTFEDSNLSYTVSGGTLNFGAGGTITNKNDTSSKTQTITSAITGSPSVDLASGNPAGGSEQYLKFAPTSGTVALGTIDIAYNDGDGGDKSQLWLSGATTGNTVASVIQTFVYGGIKQDSGEWTLGNVNAGRIWLNGGTMIINGTFSSPYQGLATFSSGARLGGNLAYSMGASSIGQFIVGNGCIVAPGNPGVANGVGTIDISYSTGTGTNATVGQTTFNAGSIYEWQVGAANATDVVHVVRTSTATNNNRTLTVGAMTLKIKDAGGTPANGAVQLPVFTYDTGVVRTLSLGSVVFDTSALDGSWTIGTLALTDDNAGTIYLTGLSKSGGVSAYDNWKSNNAPTGNPDDDFDGDGVSNAVEFVLGGDKDTNDLNKLPTVSENGTSMTFNFVRDQASIDESTSVKIEVGIDLATWPSSYSVPDTDTGGIVNPGVTVVSGAGTDTVTLRVPQSAGKKFARLKVVITP